MDMRYCSECGSEYNALDPNQIGLDGVGCWKCNPKPGQEAHRLSVAAAELGRKGGSRTSERKAKSSAANGRLGGRPKKAK